MPRRIAPQPEIGNAGDSPEARTAEATAFLTAMFGEVTGGQAVLSVINNDGTWGNAVASADLAKPNTLVELAQTAIQMSDENLCDVYVSTSIVDGGGRKGDDVLSTPAVWTEFDFAESSEKKDYAPWSGPAEVEKFISERIGLPPSIIVSSGNGLHCYWLFDEPLTWWGIDEESRSESVLTRWEQWLHSEAEAAGHGLDTVVDLARVLRVPGTFNRKSDDPKPVTTQKLEPSLTYSVNDIDDHVPGNFAGRSLRGGHSSGGHSSGRFVTDDEILDYISTFADETTDHTHVQIAEAEMTQTGGGRHFALLRALGVLIQNQQRGTLNLAGTLAAWSDKFDSIKDPSEQTYQEFNMAVRDVARKRMAELDSLYSPGQRIYDLIEIDETLGDVVDIGHTDVQKLSTLDSKIAERIEQMQVNEAAREYVTQEQAEARFDNEWEQPSFVSVQDFLMRQYEPVEFRVEGLWTTESKVILSAEAKAGKTTLVLNLLDAMVDGGKFLDRFRVKQSTGKVAFVNFEVSERQMHEWLGRGSARNLDGAIISNQIGGAGNWDVRQKQVREALGASLSAAGATVLIIDTLGMILDALGIDENSNSEVGEMLSGFDALLAETTISELFIVHHFGHSGDRARGASKLLGWPDALWTYHRDEEDDDENLAPRFFTVRGRDVSLPKSEVLFNADTSQVSMKQDARNPKQAKAQKLASRDIATVLVAVRALVAQSGDADHECTSNDITDESGISKNRIKATLNEAVKRGELDERAGPRNARLFRISEPKPSIVDQIPSTTLHHPPPPSDHSEGSQEGAPRPLPSTSYGGRREVDGSSASGKAPPSSGLSEGGQPAVDNSEAGEAMADALIEASAQAQSEMPFGSPEEAVDDIGHSDDRACPRCGETRILIGGELRCRTRECR